MKGSQNAGLEGQIQQTCINLQVFKALLVTLKGEETQNQIFFVNHWLNRNIIFNHSFRNCNKNVFEKSNRELRHVFYT